MDGTPFDFLKAKLIGADMTEITRSSSKGYDHTMVLDNAKGNLSRAAGVCDPDSGRLLECWTTEPAVHFFTGNNPGGLTGKGGAWRISLTCGVFLFGDTALSGFTPNHPGVSEYDFAAGGGLPARDGVSVFGADKGVGSGGVNAGFLRLFLLC